MELHGKPTDPYRIFFPLGLILGVIGVAIWPLYAFGATATYSGRSHAFVQTSGFLFAFIAGFLLTAIPRFTGTEAPALMTQYVMAAIVSIGAMAFEFRFFAVGNVLFSTSYFMLMALAARRFLQRQQDPPDTFSLVGIGLVAGALGSIINTGIALNIMAPSLDLLGKRLLTEGMALLLVLGIGGFLGPRLLGFAALPKFQSIGNRPQRSSVFFLYAIAGLAIFLSLILEYGSGLSAMAFVRAAAATAVVSGTLQPWRLPAMRTTLAWCVWVAHWLTIVTLWVSAIAPRYRIDLLHVLFIGGFSLLILAVATRVTLSHGGHSLALEHRSWPLRIGLVTLLIAMAARAAAPLAPASYFRHLAYASLLWIGGMVFWGFFLCRSTGSEGKRF
jgi:uncharacterized protein involved in response to NO